MMEALDNKYSKWYYKIIAFRLMNPFDGYTERHHIYPVSLGGSDDPNNLVRLSAREHFVCHLLLARMFHGIAKHKMIRAANALLYFRSGNRKLHADYKVSARMYQQLKASYAELMKGPRSDELKKKMSIAKRAASQARGFRPLSDSHRASIAKGKLASAYKHPEAAKQAISEAAILRYQTTDIKSLISQRVFNSNGGSKGWKWVNNGIIHKRIRLEEVEAELNKGWKLGRLAKRAVI